MNFRLIIDSLRREAPYRQKQFYQALFSDLITDFSELTVFPLALREKLAKISGLEVKGKIFGSGDSYRALIEFTDGLKTETVLMLHKDQRVTACLSSQIGCPLGCAFCATGKLGFVRDLDYGEIIAQLLFWKRFLKEKYPDLHLSNVVFMGMGEPFLNWENVKTAINIINDKNGFNIGARKISISTSGVKGGILKLADFPLQVNLALSLHAVNSRQRSIIMPINNAHPIKEVLLEVEDYLKQTGRKIMFEYLLLQDFNDTNEDALALAKLAKEYQPSTVNILNYNQTEQKSMEGFKASTMNRVSDFEKILADEGVNYVRRYKFGDEISGACGQLALKKH